MKLSFWDRKLYPNLEDRDAATLFIKTIKEKVLPDATVLDVGAGGGLRSLYDFRGKCHEMIGIDLDPKVTENPLLDRGLLMDGNSIPLPDHSVDFAFSIYVLEHVSDPEAFCNEISRVLKPGGEFWAITPNRYHYVALVAALTPTAFHKWFNKTRGRAADDTFDTFYRLNSARALKRHFASAGMEVIEIKTIEIRPNYLQFSTPLFLLGAAYERVVNSSAIFSKLRVNYIAGFRKAHRPA
jgi:SAM-dependent methyltransferase